MAAHYFMIDDIASFQANLEAREYSRSGSDSWVTYSKVLSGAIVKYYGFHATAGEGMPSRIRVTYDFVKEGRPLEKLIRELKNLNFRYRQALPGWKTKKDASSKIRDNRWSEMRGFFQRHDELIQCFQYKGDERTEGNNLFNLQVASTPQQQRLCMDLIKGLVEAETPHGIVRRRREAAKPLLQRNGWIRRYAQIHKLRGWLPYDIARSIQKELRNGTWNERSRLQYNIADKTICKIAGMKIPSRNS